MLYNSVGERTILWVTFFIAYILLASCTCRRTDRWTKWLIQTAALSLNNLFYSHWPKTLRTPCSLNFFDNTCRRTIYFSTTSRWTKWLIKTAALSLNNSVRFSWIYLVRSCSWRSVEMYANRSVQLIFIHRPFLSLLLPCVYWVPQKLPQIYTVIAYICIVKVAWFAAYIFGNLLVAVQIKGSRWLWRHWCSIHHWCATSWATPKIFCQEPLIFDRLNNQAGSKWADIICK